MNLFKKIWKWLSRGDLYKLSAEDLAKKKTIREVKNLNVLWNGIFKLLPLATAVVTIWVLMESNVFEVNSKLLEVTKKELSMEIHDFELKKDSLHKRVIALQTYISAEEDTIKGQRHKIESQIRDNKRSSIEKDSLDSQIRQEKEKLNSAISAKNENEQIYFAAKDGEREQISYQRDSIKNLKLDLSNLLEYNHTLDSILSDCIEKYKLPVNIQQIRAQMPTIYYFTHGWDRQ